MGTSKRPASPPPTCCGRAVTTAYCPTCGAAAGHPLDELRRRCLAHAERYAASALFFTQAAGQAADEAGRRRCQKRAKTAQAQSDKWVGWAEAIGRLTESP